MKISVSGGNKNINKSININDKGISVENISKEKITKPSNTSTVVESVPKKETREVKVEKKEPKKETKEVPKEKSTMAVNGVKTVVSKEFVKDVIQPINFVSETAKEGALDTILSHINAIRSLSGLITDEESFDLADIFLDLYEEFENRPSATNANLHTFLTCIEKAALLIDKISDEDKKLAFNNKYVTGIIDEYDNLIIGDDNEEETEVAEEISEEKSEDNDIRGFCMVNGSIENLKDIDPEQPSKKVLLIMDDSNNYILSSNNDIIGVDMINNRHVDSLAMVSKEWLDNVQQIIKAQENEEAMKDDDEDTLIENVNGEEV